MDKQDFCQSCDQKNHCQDVYRRLGHAEGPSVVSKVVAAFLLPIVVFVVSLAVFEVILAKAVDMKGLQTALSLLLALLVTAVCVLTIKAISKQLSKDK